MHLAEPQTQELRAIPDGMGGIKATLAAMSAFVNQYKYDPRIRGLAVELTLHLPQKYYAGEANALFQFVRDQIRYVQDIAGMETVQSPVATLDNGAGDCDDKATLLAALLESINHKTRFIACGFRPGEISHVYVETKVGQSWVPLDATEDVAMGWAPPGIVTRKEWHN